MSLLLRLARLIAGRETTIVPGPRPIRSREHPRGFPWLAQKDKIKADEGTLLAERTWEIFNLASDVGAFYLGEFPEDLGATKNGIPASIWQMQQVQDLLVLPGCSTLRAVTK